MFNPPYWYYDNVKFSDIEIINLKTDLFGSEKTEEMSKIVDYVNSLGLNIPKLKIDPVRQISTYHYNMDNKPDNIFKEIYDVIVEDILKSVGVLKNVEYKHTFWAQLYQKGMLHAPHHHGEDDISWVHFLNVPKEKLFRFTDTEGNVYVPQEQNNGDIICFPSWLWHEVLPNETDEDRLVTAGNIKITNLL